MYSASSSLRSFRKTQNKKNEVHERKTFSFYWRWIRRRHVEKIKIMLSIFRMISHGIHSWVGSEHEPRWKFIAVSLILLSMRLTISGTDAVINSCQFLCSLKYPWDETCWMCFQEVSNFYTFMRCDIQFN